MCDVHGHSHSVIRVIMWARFGALDKEGVHMLGTFVLIGAGAPPPPPHGRQLRGVGAGVWEWCRWLSTLGT
jgi:hypothetical protein